MWTVRSFLFLLFQFRRRRPRHAFAPLDIQKNAHWFFSLRRVIACVLSAPATRRTYFRLPSCARQLQVFSPLFLSLFLLFDDDDARLSPSKPLKKNRRALRRVQLRRPLPARAGDFRPRLFSRAVSWIKKERERKRNRERERMREREERDLARHWRLRLPSPSSSPHTPPFFLHPNPTNNSAATPPSRQSPASASPTASAPTWAPSAPLPPRCSPPAAEEAPLPSPLLLLPPLPPPPSARPRPRSTAPP